MKMNTFVVTKNSNLLEKKYKMCEYLDKKYLQ
jgi:hypothetical protein